MSSISSIDDALRVIKQNPNTPLTIATHARIGGYVVDGRYVAATPAAAELFGLETAAELKRLYMSETHDIAEYKQGLKMAFVRSRGYDITMDYPVRIRTGNAIYKHTIPIQDTDGSMYWVTWLEPADISAQLPDFNINDFDIPEEDIRSWCGLCTVAEMSDIVANYQIMTNLMSRHISETQSCLDALTQLSSQSPSPLTRGMESHIMITESHTTSSRKSMTAGTQEGFLFAPGNMVQLPEGTKRAIPFTHMYWCANCNEISMTKIRSATENEAEIKQDMSLLLEKCRKCGSPYWHGNAIKDVRRSKT